MLAFEEFFKFAPFLILEHIGIYSAPKIAVFSYKSIKMFAIGEMVVVPT